MSKSKSRSSTGAADISSGRDLYLDVLKGFAILLVVFGHSLQSFVAHGNFDDNILFRFIYSFHMPLFMFLCGVVATYSSRAMNFDFLKRKFLMLVVPFVAWFTVSYFVNGLFHTTGFLAYVGHVFTNPDAGLWFLWALFLNFCALALIKHVQKHVGLVSYALVWLAIYAIPTGKYGIGLVKWHLPFFAAGYLIYTHQEALARYRKLALRFCVVAFPLLVASWHRLYLPSPIVHLQGHLAAHNVLALSAGGLVTVNTFNLATLIYTYLVPITGIGFFFWVFRLKPTTYVYRPLAFLGMYTLDIYTAHFYFLRFGFGPSWLQIISGFVIALVMALALGFLVLRQVPLLSTIFLGGRAKALPLAVIVDKLRVKSLKFIKQPIAEKSAA